VNACARAGVDVDCTGSVFVILIAVSIGLQALARAPLPAGARTNTRAGGCSVTCRYTPCGGCKPVQPCCPYAPCSPVQRMCPMLPMQPMQQHVYVCGRASPRSLADRPCVSRSVPPPPPCADSYFQRALSFLEGAATGVLAVRLACDFFPTLLEAHPFSGAPHFFLGYPLVPFWLSAGSASLLIGVAAEHKIVQVRAPSPYPSPYPSGRLAC
jgi:hypothetical protein